jgi:flagellar hook protein FlgE
LRAPVDVPFMISSIGSAMTGMATAVRKLDAASARIAQPAPANLVGDRVEQLLAQHSFEANLATVRTADQMLGTLIDTFA